ncbi:hypothetical protein [Niveispirillum sp. KHB5.9]|uniref:hypothetical protein n=1 Tax=Niveispirillum sp. KHB5.9 TaxID=3400269 RepID=UPI003A85F78C
MSKYEGGTGPIINVTSHNQQGGITAYQVLQMNQEPPIPIFTQENLKEIIHLYGQDAKFVVDRFDSTVRTFQFCGQMVEVMRAGGLNVDFSPMRQAMGLPPFNGIQIGPNDGKIFIQVMNI